MHNLTKIRLYRLLLYCSYIPSLFIILPLALLKRRNPGNLFFFFDRDSLGGAQRIHLDVLKTVEALPKQIYFTRYSADHTLQSTFYSLPNADVKDIHKWCDNLLLRLFAVHYFTFYINRHKAGHVFSSNSTFFYDMLPFIKKGIIKTELLHMFTYGKNGMEFFGLANHQFLNNRIVYDSLTLANLKEQYKNYKVPASLLSRVIYIEPGVSVLSQIPSKIAPPPLKILYAGRGGAQKRIWILDKIASICITEGLTVQFHFAGNMQDELSEMVKEVSVLHGQISDAAEMASLYRDADVLLMTSAYEGFPMAIKEAMAQACVPVVTALEGNKTHLTNGYNAILLANVDNEEELVKEGVAQLKLLANNNDLLAQLSKNAFQYARDHFDRSVFYEKYKKLLECQ